jgi:SPP1 gp7 family putative phage head morphogenesis protein
MTISFPDRAREQFAGQMAERLEELDDVIIERLTQVGLRLDADGGPSPSGVSGAIQAGVSYVKNEIDLTEISFEVIDKAEEHHKEQIRESYKEVGARLAIMPDIPDQRREDFRKLMRSRGNELLLEHLEFLEENTLAALEEGRRAEDIADTFAERLDVSKRKGELVARDTLGSFQGFQNKHRMQKLGIETYIWRTSQDERVRDSHAALGGTRQRWDQPPLVGHPGEDQLCRCDAEVDFAAVSAPPASKPTRGVNTPETLPRP